MTLTYGLDPAQFHRYVVRPANLQVAMNSRVADELVLGTAMTESHLKYIDQLDAADEPGPAYGPFQMEMATHNDIWNNYLLFHPTLRSLVRACVVPSRMMDELPQCAQLRWNWLYASAMCRVHYRRKPSMPSAGDARSLATYWKLHYNTPLGKGTVEGALPHFQRAIEIVGANS